MGGCSGGVAGVGGCSGGVAGVGGQLGVLILYSLRMLCTEEVHSTVCVCRS